MNKTYWMADDVQKLVKHMAEFHGQWTIWGSNPICQAWVRNSICYYSTVLDPAAWDTSLVFEGEQGELVKMAVPQARSLVRQFVGLTTKQKLAFNCIAESRGSDVIKETRLGNALAAQIVEMQHLDQKQEMLAEQAAVLGMAFVKTCWRTDKGKPYAVGQDQSLMYDGELEITTPSIFDVFFDYSVPYWDDLEWVEVRTMKSRWSLMAQFPELADKISSLPTIRDWRGPHSNTYRTVSEEDFVYCYEIYHKPTPALPQGRMVMYSSPETIYHDGINEYDGIPIEVVKPEPIIGTGFGYPYFSNLLPAQEMLDHSFSAIATNQSAFAVQQLAVPRGAAVSVEEIGGMNFMSYTPQNVPGGGKPEAMQLTQSSPETFKFIDLLLAHMQQVSNVNPALRGNPPPGVTSGVAIATLTTNSLEFISSFSKSLQFALERTMTHGINAYRKFAKIPHIVSLVGKNFQSYNKEFVGSDLDPIKQVKISVSNPLMQTLAGRTDMAEKLMQGGLIKDIQSYVSVIDGAPLQQLYETELSENDLVQAENESLMEGKPVMALSTDDHPRHIQRHASLLNDPEVRLNNDKVSIILNHIMEHSQLAQTTDPTLTAMVRTGKMPQMGPPPSQAGQGPLPPQSGEMGPETAQPEQQSAEPASDLLGRG
jgi:hypothetical protein